MTAADAGLMARQTKIEAVIRGEKAKRNIEASTFTFFNNGLAVCALSAEDIKNRKSKLIHLIERIVREVIQ